MKKIFAVAMATLMSLSVFNINALADTELKADVYVTISDKDGRLAITQEKITVTDIDDDNVLTINDALYAAHEAKYEGGAKAGYMAVDSEWGISLVKLWGAENGGSYGYYVNNQSAMSLVDVVKEGDYINAYVYTDLTAWTDTYCYFDKNVVTGEAGKNVGLKLLAAGYDADFNPITIPVENAVITIDGEETDYKTDKDGNVTITVASEGTYVISAVSDTQTLVPPACKVVIEASKEEETTKEQETTTEEQITTAEETTTEKETTTAEKEVPPTGDNSSLMIFVAALVASFTGVLAISIKNRKVYEK